jgi:hypothetical protein
MQLSSPLEYFILSHLEELTFYLQPSLRIKSKLIGNSILSMPSLVSEVTLLLTHNQPLILYIETSQLVYRN